MNLHAPQSWEARAEIAEIMHVPKQFLSPAQNKPVMGLVQDSITLASVFTRECTMLTREVMMELMMEGGVHDRDIPDPITKDPKWLWSPKQLISMLLPPSFNLNKKSSYPNSPNVRIENGQYLEGRLCKKTLGSSEGGIIHGLTLYHGTDAAKKFMFGMQKILNRWGQRYGFNVSFEDIIPASDTKDQIREIVKTMNEKISLDGDRRGEEWITTQVNNVISKTGSIVQDSLSENNSIRVMVDSGGKGSRINSSQIMGCIGQQNVNGKRIEFELGERTLPMFDKWDNSAHSRGFCMHSYYEGLNPEEVLYHAKGGREGLVDTSVKTSDTGYTNHRLLKKLESLKVNYDGTVRHSNGMIIEFAFGEDNIDASYMERCQIRFERAQIIAETLNDDRAKAEINRIKTLLKYAIRKEETYALPINIPKIQEQIGILGESVETLHLVTYDEVEEFAQQVYKEQYHLMSRLIPTGFKNTLVYFSIFAELYGGMISYERFILIKNKILKTIQRACIQPGEMVGPIAAQSIGEPIQQKTLNVRFLTMTVV